MVCPEGKELSNYLFETQNQIKSSRKANNQQETGFSDSRLRGNHDIKTSSSSFSFEFTATRQRLMPF